MAAALPAAEAQLLTSVGSSARGTTVGASEWRPSAALTSSLRFDSPLWSANLDAGVESRFGAAPSSAGSLQTVLASPSLGGLRLIGSSSVDRDRSVVAA